MEKITILVNTSSIDGMIEPSSQISVITRLFYSMAYKLVSNS